jgi:hypothetical protein
MQIGEKRHFPYGSLHIKDPPFLLFPIPGTLRSPGRKGAYGENLEVPVLSILFLLRPLRSRSIPLVTTISDPDPDWTRIQKKEKCKNFKGTVLRDWIGPCMELMDST